MSGLLSLTWILNRCRWKSLSRWLLINHKTEVNHPFRTSEKSGNLINFVQWSQFRLNIKHHSAFPYISELTPSWGIGVARKPCRCGFWIESTVPFMPNVLTPLPVLPWITTGLSSSTKKRDWPLAISLIAMMSLARLIQQLHRNSACADANGNCASVKSMQHDVMHSEPPFSQVILYGFLKVA